MTQPLRLFRLLWNLSGNKIHKEKDKCIKFFIFVLIQIF